ncbi:hypothetical protein TNCV_2704881 [Trichonephila clavipes]|nr:hypothetical protein TNCV_2704881 [Trichonephila clavipes]
MTILSNQPKNRTRLCRLGSVYIGALEKSSQSSKSLMRRSNNASEVLGEFYVKFETGRLSICRIKLQQGRIDCLILGSERALELSLGESVIDSGTG